MIYYALFTSHMNYCCQLWGQSTNQYIKRISVLQNRALRLTTFFNYREHSSPLYKYLYILKFSDFVLLQKNMFIYDIFTCNLPRALLNTFEINFEHA